MALQVLPENQVPTRAAGASIFSGILLAWCRPLLVLLLTLGATDAPPAALSTLFLWDPDGEEPALQLRGAASAVGPAGRREPARDVPAVQGHGLVRRHAGR